MSVVRADGTPVEDFADVDAAVYVPDDPVTVVTERVYREVPYPGGGATVRTLLWPAGQVVQQSASERAFATGDVVRADGSEVADASELSTEAFTADDPAFVLNERLYKVEDYAGGGATVRALLWHEGQVVRQSQAELAFGGPTGSPGGGNGFGGPAMITATVTTSYQGVDESSGDSLGWLVNLDTGELDPARELVFRVNGQDYPVTTGGSYPGLAPAYSDDLLVTLTDTVSGLFTETLYHGNISGDGGPLTITVGVPADDGTFPPPAAVAWEGTVPALPLPFVVDTNGGAVAAIWGPFDENTTVSVGGTPATVAQTDPDGLYFVAPPHVPNSLTGAGTAVTTANPALGSPLALWYTDLSVIPQFATATPATGLAPGDTVSLTGGQGLNRLGGLLSVHLVRLSGPSGEPVQPLEEYVLTPTTLSLSGTATVVIPTLGPGSFGFRVMVNSAWPFLPVTAEIAVTG